MLELYAMLREVDIQDKRLTESESAALAKMLVKREQYVRQGRAKEAHGLGTGIWILWRTLIDEPEGATGYGGL
jgi:hypothetical protein